MFKHLALRTFFIGAACLFLQNFNRHPLLPSAIEAHADLPQKAYRLKKVVLDAGHGGKDPGCMGSYAREKNSTLAIVLKLGDLIEQHYPEVQVIYTRKTDVFVELNERSAIANRNNADLFISVHCNAMPNSSATHGTETYVLGLHKAQHNLEVAKRENASIYLEANYKRDYAGYDPNSAEAHILGSMWQSAYLEQSIVLASFVQQQARNLANRQDKGVKQAGFLVLKENAMPSILVETGYMTNRAEEDFLASDNGQQQMALSIFRAFQAYKQQMEGGDVPALATRGQSTRTPAPRKTATPAEPVVKPKVEPTPAPATKPIVQYRILLMTWSSRMDRKSGQLGLLSDVTEEKEGNQYKYFTGNFTSLAEAERTLPEIKNLGFRTAVIVAK